MDFNASNFSGRGDMPSLESIYPKLMDLGLDKVVFC